MFDKFNPLSFGECLRLPRDPRWIPQSLVWDGESDKPAINNDLAIAITYPWYSAFVSPAIRAWMWDVSSDHSPLGVVCVGLLSPTELWVFNFVSLPITDGVDVHSPWCAKYGLTEAVSLLASSVYEDVFAGRKILIQAFADLFDMQAGALKNPRDDAKAWWIISTLASTAQQTDPKIAHIPRERYFTHYVFEMICQVDTTTGTVTQSGVAEARPLRAPKDLRPIPNKDVWHAVDTNKPLGFLPARQSGLLTSRNGRLPTDLAFFIDECEKDGVVPTYIIKTPQGRDRLRQALYMLKVDKDLVNLGEIPHSKRLKVYRDAVNRDYPVIATVFTQIEGLELPKPRNFFVWTYRPLTTPRVKQFLARYRGNPPALCRVFNLYGDVS